MKKSLLIAALSAIALQLVYGMEYPYPRECPWGWGFINEQLLSNDIQQVQKAIQKGADVNVQDKYKRTALHIATSRSRIDIIKLLIDAGVNINAQDYYGVTVLHKAIEYKFPIDVIKFLLNAGADINALYINQTPLDNAIACGNIQAAKLITNYSELLKQITLNPNKQLLTQVIDLGFSNLVKLLLKIDVKPDLHDLALATQKYMQSLDNFDKDTYVTIGRMLLQHVRLNGLVQASKHNQTMYAQLKKFYHRVTHLFWPTESTTAKHAHGPISNSGLGLPEHITHTIASFTY